MMAYTHSRRCGSIAATLALAFLIGATPGLTAQETGEYPTPDPRVESPTARSIALDEAIGIALERSTDLARAAGQATAAELAVDDARSDFFPDLSLSVNGGASFGRTFSESEGGLVNETTSSGLASLRANVVLFDGFSNTATLSGARLSARAQSSDTYRLEESVAFAVVTGYLSLAETREQLRVARESLVTEEERRSEVQAQVDAGSRPIAELYQQQATVAAARAALVDAERLLESARLDLVGTLRLDPDEDVSFEVPELDERPGRAQLDIDALTQQALARRTDLAAADLRVGAADEATRAVSGLRLPTVGLSAAYGTNASSISNDAVFGQLDSRRSGSLSLSISIPVIDNGSASRTRQRADVSAYTARLEIDDLRQDIALEVRRAVAEVRSAEAALDAAEVRMQAAEQALAVTEQRYEAGASTLLEVAQTRTEFVDATSAWVRARYVVRYQDALLEYRTGSPDVGQSIS